MTIDLPSNKIVVTSALPYANGEIHLGHIVSTYLPADIFTRYCRLKQYNVIHICASDDFGTPILINAEKNNKSPEEYVEYWNKKDQEDFKDLGVSFDFFHKTSSKENISLTQYFFEQLQKNGYIYKREVTQPYCEKDLKYLPDRYVLGSCPYCNALGQYSDGCEKCGRTFESSKIINPVCSLCGQTPIYKKSEHFFFRLSFFSEKLRSWLIKNKGLQDETKNYLLKWIEDELMDWDITRDINWGVPIPADKSKVFYGWFDNHICYISSTITFLDKKNINGKSFWNEATIYHYIGKDIIYHHYLFLPAMRMGLNEEYKLPDFIPTRGHLLLQGNKFSKSRGWYISLREFLDAFPPDYLRYYLAAITPYDQSDINFDWDEFRVRINNELVANIGNFIYRTLKFISNNNNCEVPTPSEYLEIDINFRNELLLIKDKVEKCIEVNELEKALRNIIEFSAICNRYFQQKEPWNNKKDNKTCLYLCVNAVKIIAILLYPYIPFSMEELWNQLNIKEQITWDAASEIGIKQSHKINNPNILFKKVEDSVILIQKSKINNKS